LEPFSSAYEKFIVHHLANASPARAVRIAGGLGHAERLFLETVWWPAFHQFDGLFPEHEVRDYDDGFRYVDFAYHLPLARIAIEIDGFGPHWRDISQDQFVANCRRQNMLILDEWRVLRFAFVDVRDHPRVCQQTLYHLLGQFTTSFHLELAKLDHRDRCLVEFAARHASISPQQVQHSLQFSHNVALRRLRSLADREWLIPLRGTHRITRYGLHPSKARILL